MTNQTKKQFIPRDKPKSWVLASICILIALFIAAPMIFFGGHYLIVNLGKFLFSVLAIAAMFFGVFLNVNVISGKYKQLKSQDWKDQLW